MQLSIITEVPEWDSLEPAWRALAAAHPDASPFMSWEWMRCWWDIYAGQRTALCILVCRVGDEVVGITPLIIERHAKWPLRPRRLRVLRLIGTGEPDADSVVTEYADLLAAPGHEQSVAQACAKWLCGAGSGRWDVLAFDNVLEGSNIRKWLVPALQARKRSMRQRLAGLRYFARLPSNWDEYLQSVGRNTRNKLTVGRRRMERNGRYAVVTYNSPEQMTAALERLAVLHKRRWMTIGHAGAFESERFRTFHHHVASRLAASGNATVTLLTLDDQDMAGVYTLATAGAAFFYQTGFDPALAANYSPGTVVIGVDIERALLEGRRGYDFMASAPGSYKAHYGCETTEMFHIYVFNRTIRGALSLALWILAGKAAALRPAQQSAATASEEE